METLRVHCFFFLSTKDDPKWRRMKMYYWCFWFSTAASVNIFSVNYIRKVFLQAAAAEEETPIRDWIWGWKKLNQVRVQQRSLNLEDTFGMLAASSPLIWNTRVPLQLGQSFVVRWRGRLKRRTDRCKFRWKLNASLSNKIIQFKGKMEIYVSSKRFYS